MASYKKSNKKKSNGVLIDADFRIKIEKKIIQFVESENSSYEFPASLTNVERAFVHNLAPKYNLKTKSHGKDDNRKLSVFKLTENDEFLNRCVKLDLDPSASNILKQFAREHPATVQSNNNLLKIAKQKTSKPMVLAKPPGIPAPSYADSRVQQKRTTLPIYAHRDRILEAIESNRIVLVHGSTGSGKTTQIPQYLLEDANMRNKPCRILCTQPRRISAIASSERVCYERSEASGRTVGYQIRLESSISQDTNCIFLTPGVFLRYLMSGDPEKLFNNITHILIDEAHERAKENDFLLTSIREHFNANPNLKLVIMSATMDTAVFAEYFGGCEEISISTKMFDVQEIYLEDILKQVNFSNRRVEELNEMYRTGQLVSASQSAYVNEQEAEGSLGIVDEQTTSYLNEILENLSTYDNPESEFNQFVYLVQAENLPVDFRHTTTNMTALMIAVGRGQITTVDSLLKMNADPNLKVMFGGTEINCVDIANQLHGSDSEMAKLLIDHLANSGPKTLSSTDVYNKAYLNIYYDTVLKTKSNMFVVEEGIDHELIAQLVEKIHNETPLDGAVLVFLPGYDDIIQASNLIKNRLQNDISLFLLHSSMKTEDQKNVFKPVMQGMRKIILSTNIAESSITIDDVVYVIDSGREKQKSYDAISHSSSLCVQWISKASANQRKGRAGRLRNGYVFRVYSSERFNSMLATTIPELLRTSLTEICLQTKLMVGDTMKIEDFLRRCIASPGIASIRQSIKFLQCLGALDDKESLTLLGSHLAQMPVDAKYAKMLIYGILLKCLDSVLSIVSILSVGDQIFVLPFHPADRFKCHQNRRKLGENSLSDHFVMLRIFQLWSNLKRNHMNDRRFCEENFISSASMEHVRGIRAQIMSYLQSSGLTNAGMQNLNVNSWKWPVVKACLGAGLYPNVARIDRSKKTMYSDIDRKLVFHMSSIMSNRNERSLDFVKNLPADWVVFEEKNRVGRTSMIRCNSLINSFSLSLTAGSGLNIHVPTNDDYGDWSDEEREAVEEVDDKTLTFKIDSLVTFTTDKNNGEFIFHLRSKLDDMILRFLNTRNFVFEKGDDSLVTTIGRLLDIEEKNSRFANVNIEAKDEVDNFRSQRNQSTGNQFSQKRGNFNSGNIAGPSRNISSSQPKFQSSNGRQRFFAMKMNSEKIVNDLASRIWFDVETLNLKPYFIQKLYSPSMASSQIFIIFYSTLRSEFLGYGDVMPSNRGQQNLQFHFRLVRKLPLDRLRQQFGNLIMFQNPSYQTEEMSPDVGNAVVNMLKS